MEKIILSKHKSTKRFQLNEVDCRTWLCTLGNLCSICNNTHQLVEIQKEISFSSRLLHYLESIDNIEYIYAFWVLNPILTFYVKYLFPRMPIIDSGKFGICLL